MRLGSVGSGPRWLGPGVLMLARVAWKVSDGLTVRETQCQIRVSPWDRMLVSCSPLIDLVISRHSSQVATLGGPSSSLYFFAALETVSTRTLLSPHSPWSILVASSQQLGHDTTLLDVPPALEVVRIIHRHELDDEAIRTCELSDLIDRLFRPPSIPGHDPGPFWPFGVGEPELLAHGGVNCREGG